MAVGIFLFHKTVVIDEIFVPCVVRRIDVDDVDFSGVGVGECGEGVEIVAFNENMVRSLWGFGDDSAFFDLGQDGQFAGHLQFHILRLVLPDQSIFLLLMKQPQQGGLLVV